MVWAVVAAIIIVRYSIDYNGIFPKLAIVAQKWFPLMQQITGGSPSGTWHQRWFITDIDRDDFGFWIFFLRI